MDRLTPKHRTAEPAPADATNPADRPDPATPADAATLATPTSPGPPTAPVSPATPASPVGPAGATDPVTPEAGATRTADAVPALGWEDLVSAALLGTEQRRVGAGVAPGVVLGAAAVHAVRRRAGLRAGDAAALPEAAPPDDRARLPAAARWRLAQLLAGRAAPAPASGRRGAAPDLAELLPQWLAAAGRHGYKAPASALPALLDAARARTDLRPLALAFAGPRGLWLARQNPEWRFALRGAAGGAALPSVHDGDAVRTLWDEGLFAERVALLAAVRAEAPAAARELLASTWAAERAEDRLMFLDSLRAGLSDADEDFLEAALTDRSRNVRATAAGLLSALPASAFAARMADRATSCIALDRTGDRTGDRSALVVEAPHECDAAMQRDGMAPTPPPGRGERSWWLGQLVESAPLSCWPARLGGRTPAEIVALPVSDDWQPELHAAWCRAAVRQGDAAWSRALLGSPSTSSLAERAKLLATLEEDERAEWVAGFVSAHGLSEAFQLLGVCGVPWAGPLGRAVVDALDIARDAGSYPWSFSGVMGLAERCLDPAAAPHLEALTTLATESEDASPGAAGYWSEAFQRLVSTLRLRAAMHAELTPS